MKFLLLLLIRGYKLIISPFLLPACRYTPSCSAYAIEAIERYGAIKGGKLALLRLLSCQPFSKKSKVQGTYDPVPKDGDL